MQVYCEKHNVATYGKATCRACELEGLAAHLAELLSAYHGGKATDRTVYETSIVLENAREYGLIKSE